jgi:hypothetical protein
LRGFKLQASSVAKVSIGRTKRFGQGVAKEPGPRKEHENMKEIQKFR